MSFRNHLKTVLHIPAGIALPYSAAVVLWIMLSGYLLAIAVINPPLQFRIEIAEMLVLIAVTIGLIYLPLYLLLKRREVKDADTALGSPPHSNFPKSLTFVLTMSMLALVVPALDITIYEVRVHQFKQNSFDNLSAIAKLKAEEIQLWLMERNHAAESMSKYGEFPLLIQDGLSKSDNTVTLHLIQTRLESMRASHGFDSVLIFAADGRLLASAGSDKDQPPRNLLHLALNSTRVQFSDLYRDDAGNIQMDWLAPVIATKSHGNRGVAVMVFRTRPANFLFNYIQTWPTSAKTGETLLVRREGDSIALLNPTRYDQAAALTAMGKLSDSSLPAAVGLRDNKPGTIAGQDYRHVPVLAAYHPVAGTDWLLIAKQDRKEVLKPLWLLLYWVSGVGAAATFMFMAMFTLFMRQQQRTHQLALQAQSAESLMENNELLRLFIEHAPVALAMFDREMRFLAYSRRWFADYAQGVQHIIGRSHYEVFPQTTARWKPFHDRALAGEVLSSDDDFFKKADGTVQWLQWEIRPWKSDDGNIGGIVIFSQDITGRKANEAKILRLSKLYAALSQCNEAIVRCTDEAELFRKICRIAVEFGGMTMAWIGMADTASRQVRPVASYGRGTEYLDGIQISMSADDPFGRGPIGTAIRDNRPFWCQDYVHDPVLAPWRDRGNKAGWKSIAALPLHRNGTPSGVLALYSDTVGIFDEDVRRLSTEMSTDLSFALDNFEHNSQRKQIEREIILKNTILETQQETSLDAILIVDKNSKILSYNRNFIEMWRLPPELVSAREDGPVLRAVAGQVENPEAFYARVQQLFAHPEMKSREEIKLKDGRIIDRYTSPITGSDGQHFGIVAYFRDITESRKAAQELADSEQRFRGLVEQSLAGIYIVHDGKFVYVNPRAAEILGYGSADDLIGKHFMQFTAEEDRGNLVETIRKLLNKEVAKIAIEFRAVHKNGHSITLGANASFAIYHGQPVVIGLIQDISEKKRAEERIQDYVTQLKTTFLSTVQLATSLSEMRDPYTAGHERRVSEIAVAIATEMGLDEQRIEGIKVAGFLHDIGKISIPTEILVKPGRLTKAEYALVQGHAQASYDVLKQVEFPWPVAIIALQHHERMDGSGYPNGLKGEETLLESRIMAVADVVEAMASHRPYRPGLGIDKALDEIERGRGTIYDPDVADSCLRLFREQEFVLPPF